MLILASQGWPDPTRVVGLIAYAGALLCCGLAWRRKRAQPAIARLAIILGLLDGALLLDMAFNWRWALHQALMDFAMRQHAYDQRGTPQRTALGLLLCLLLVGIGFAWRSLRGRGTTLIAVGGAMLSLIFWCTEVVSLHAVDHVLYSSILGVSAVSFLWILACCLTSLGILLDPQ